MNDEVMFGMQINRSLLHVDGINLGVRSQAFPKYPEQQVYKIFAISQGKREG